jgi:hypothetical protein
MGKGRLLGVNFTNILGAAFAPIFLSNKVQTYNSQHKKAIRKTIVQKAGRKMVVKLTAGH